MTATPTPTMRTRTTGRRGRHPDEESSVGPDAVRTGNGRGDRGLRDNEPPLSDETRRLGEGVNGRRGRPTAALDEADAMIGDGALAGIAGAPAPAPLAVIYRHSSLLFIFLCLLLLIHST